MVKQKAFITADLFFTGWPRFKLAGICPSFKCLVKSRRGDTGLVIHLVIYDFLSYIVLVQGYHSRTVDNVEHMNLPCILDKTTNSVFAPKLTSPIFNKPWCFACGTEWPLNFQEWK